MRGLLVAEFRRLLARRVTWVAGLALLAVSALVVIPFILDAAPPTAAELAESQRYLQQAQQEWDSTHVEQERECVENGERPEDCTWPRPTEADYGLEPPPFKDTGTAVVYGVATLAMLAALVVGASFIGAEFSSGSLGNWLTFVPRRVPVLVSKLVPLAALAAGASAIVVTGVVTALGIATAAYGGRVDGLDVVVAAGGRAVALVTLAAVLGFCLALVSRHTVAALGVVLGYLVLSLIVSVAVQSLPSLAWVPPWLPDINLEAVLQNGTEYGVATRTLTSGGAETDFESRTLSLAHGVVYWSVLAVAALIGTAAIFRRRDVT